MVTSSVYASNNVAFFATPHAVPLQSLLVIFKTQQEGSGEPGPNNIRTIKPPATSATIYHCGRNLFNLSAYLGNTYASRGMSHAVQNDGSIIANGTAQDTTYCSLSLTTSNLPAGKYLAHIGSWETYGSSKNAPYMWDSSQSARIKDWTGSNMTFTPETKCARILLPENYEGINMVMTIRYLEGAVAENEKWYPAIYNQYDNEYNLAWEPYMRNIYSVDLSNLSGVFNQMYDGYIDLVQGIVRPLSFKTRPESFLYSGTVGDLVYVQTPISAGHHGTSNKIISNICRSNNVLDVSENGGILALHMYNGQTASIQIWARQSDFATPSDLANYLISNNAEFVYRNTGSYSTSITPQTIYTYKGKNNIWTNTGAELQVVYPFEETKDILDAKKYFFMPKLYTAKGDNGSAVMKTNLLAKPKSAKVYFSVGQDGQYEPTVDNVRPLISNQGAIRLTDGICLPDTYQKVEYIRGAITWSAIDTGIVGDVDDIQFDMTFMVETGRTYGNIMGCYVNENSNGFRLIQYNNTNGNGFFYTRNRRAGSSLSVIKPTEVSSYLNKKTRVYLSLEKWICEIDGYTRTSTFTADTRGDTNVSGRTITLNAVSNVAGHTSAYTNEYIKWYECKIWKFGMLVRHLVPCYRKSDNKVGMYDLASDTFFTERNGDNNFTAGPNEIVEFGYIYPLNMPSIINGKGGYIDFATGEFVITHNTFLMDGDTNSAYYSSASMQGTDAIRTWCYPYDTRGSSDLDRFIMSGENNSEIKCDSLTPVAIGAPTKNQICGSDVYPSSFNFTLPFGEGYVEEATLDGVRAYLSEHPISVYAKLKNPFAYNLPALTNTSIKGTHIFTSNYNRPVEIQYWTH